MSYSGIPITPLEVIYSIRHLEPKEFVCFVQTILFGYVKNVTKPIGKLTISRSILDRQYQRCYCELVDPELIMYYACINQKIRVGQVVEAAGKVGLFGGLINIVSVTKIFAESEMDKDSIASLDDEIKKQTYAPKPWELRNKCDDVIQKLREYENSSLVLRVGTILRNYVCSKKGDSIYLHVSRFEAGTLAKTFYCEMVDKNGNVYYGYTPMKVFNGKKVCVKNPIHIPFANCFAVTIIEDKKDKKTDSVTEEQKKPCSSGNRKQTFNRSHQFYDPLREEWKAKINDYRIFSYSASGICSKCKRMFGEGEGYVIRKLGLFLCDACRESIRPSVQSKYRDPRAHFISTPMGGQKKK